MMSRVSVVGFLVILLSGCGERQHTDLPFDVTVDSQAHFDWCDRITGDLKARGLAVRYKITLPGHAVPQGISFRCEHVPDGWACFDGYIEPEEHDFGFSTMDWPGDNRYWFVSGCRSCNKASSVWWCWVLFAVTGAASREDDPDFTDSMKFSVYRYD